MPKKFTVSDGTLILFLQPADHGWYAVTSPDDPGITTQAKTVEDAFRMAYDAQKSLRAARLQLAQEFAAGTRKPKNPTGARKPESGRRAVKRSEKKAVES